MKKLLILGSCVLIAFTARAQQKPHYTQYILNQYIVNPALTGIENYTDIKLSHRHQWTGIQDAPVTSYLTIHGPIGKKDYRTTATSFEVPGENPRGKQYWQDYTSAEPHHGVGLIAGDQRRNRPAQQFFRVRDLCLSHRSYTAYKPVRRIWRWHQPYQS